MLVAFKREINLNRGMKKLIFLIPILLLLSASTFAYECEFKVEHLDSVRIQQGHFKQTDTCYISVATRKTLHMEYRSYLMTSRGKFLVFNSFGEGPSSQFTGAREFNFFGREKRISYQVLENEIVVNLSNGDQLLFDKESGEPLSLGRGIVELDPMLSRTNNGGIELPNYRGLVLDSGFKMGMSPSYYLSRKSTFRDQFNNQCTVVNREIFHKKGDETYWVYESDRDLYKYLQKRCPSLILEKN